MNTKSPNTHEHIDPTETSPVELTNEARRVIADNLANTMRHYEYIIDHPTQTEQEKIRITPIYERKKAVAKEFYHANSNLWNCPEFIDLSKWA